MNFSENFFYLKQNVPSWDAHSTKNFCPKSNTFQNISFQSFQIGSGTPCILKHFFSSTIQNIFSESTECLHQKFVKEYNYDRKYVLYYWPKFQVFFCRKNWNVIKFRHVLALPSIRTQKRKVCALSQFVLRIPCIYVQFTFQKCILFSLNGYQFCIRIRGKINVKSNCLNIHREILKNVYQVPIVFTYWILDISKLIKNLGVQQVICSKSFGVC